MKKKIEVFFKTLFLKVFLLFMPAKKSTEIPVLTADDKILLVRLNRIGDALVTSAFIEQLRKHTPAQIHVLADSKNYFVFKQIPAVNNIYVMLKNRKDYLTLLERLRQEQYKVIVDLHDDVSTTASLIIAKLQAPFKFGLEKKNSRIFTATTPKLDSTSTHVIERNLELLKLFGFSPDRAAAGIHYLPEPASIEKAEEFMQKRFPEKKFTVGVNISAGSEARFWGIRKYQEFVKFLKNYNINIVLLSTSRDLKHAFRIYNERDKIFYTPSFDEFAAIMSKIDLLFSPDTATVHLAAIYKLPVFGIYVKYATEDMIWYPYGCDFDCVVTREPTLQNVTVNEVIAKFKPFLEKYLVS
jgi:ADP-heptose:LPS heptosyltransferase